MTSPTRARFRPAWLLLLLMAVTSAVAVPAARPAPAPSRLEDPRPVVCETGGAHSSAHVFSGPVAAIACEVPVAGWPSPLESRLGVGNGDPPRARPPASPFALHQRPPPSVFHA